MIKALGFIACAASLIILTLGYNRWWKKRHSTYLAVLSVVSHIKRKMREYPDTPSMMLADYTPSTVEGEALASALCNYYLTASRGEAIPESISVCLDEDDTERLRAFAAALGGSCLTDERARCSEIHAHFEARADAIGKKREETRRLSSLLLACALGGLLMLVL